MYTSKQSTIYMFADDYIVYSKMKTIEDHTYFQRYLDELTKWADKWKWSSILENVLDENKSILILNGNVVHIKQVGTQECW